MTTPKYFVYPFATAGITATVPDPTQTNNTVSYQSGFTSEYSLNYSDPSSLNVPLDQFNQLMQDITGAIQQIQQYGIPYFITSAMNDGGAFAYAKNAIVYQPVDGNVYQSLVTPNTDVPPSSKWQLFGASSSLWLNFAADTGGANAYVVAPSPPITAYAAGQVVLLKPTLANTGASTINVNGLGTVPIKTLTNLDPSAGMMIPSGMYVLAYNATTSAFVLTNPTLGTAAYANTGALNGNLSPLNITASANGKDVRGPITYQWGTAIGPGSQTPGTITFGTAFSAAPWFVTVNPTTTSHANFTTGSEATPGVYNQTATGATFLLQNSGSDVQWFAIGPT